MTQLLATPVDLPTLETLLQKRLQETLLDISPVSVACFRKAPTLLIVIQHHEPPLKHPTRAFRLIEEVFNEQKLYIEYRGLLYLKVDGSDRPYAFHTVTRKPTQNDVAEQVRAITPEGLQEKEELEARAQKLMEERKAELNLGKDEEKNGAIALEKSKRSEHQGDELEEVSKGEDEALEGEEKDAQEPIEIEVDDPFSNELELVKDDFETLIDEEEGNSQLTPEKEPEPEALETKPQLSDKVWFFLASLSALIFVTVFLGSVYVLTRPCVLSRCDYITRAQQLALDAEENTKSPPSGESILKTQQQLQEATALLRSIPWWSGQYNEAQAQLKSYEERERNVEKLIKVIEKAWKTSNLTQKPPLEAGKWQEAVRLWKEAIAELETFSESSDFYPFIRTKIEEYGKNLTAIEKRLAMEKEAVKNLQAAKEAAKIAQARYGIAQSLEDVENVYETWKGAIEGLKSISKGTTPYVEAQSLLNLYLPKLSQIRDRTQQELLAEDAYKQALGLSELARGASTRAQWTEAVNYWQNALNTIRQIPEDTFYFIKARQAIEEYTLSLNNAKSQLKEAVKVTQARDALNQICAGTTTICVYSITDNLISIRLTPAYVKKVRQTARNARSRNDLNSEVNLLDSVFSLEQALEKISREVGIPLQIYTNNNILLKSYKP